MPFEIGDKVALLFGAARGIGRAFAEALLEAGAKVCIADVLEKEGLATERKLGMKHGKDEIVFTVCDLTKPDDIKHAFEKTLETFHRLDIVCDNAGILQEFDIEKAFAVNVFGVIRVTEEALRYMGKDCGGIGGVIVHTGSVSSLFPDDWAPVYCASKHAMLAHTRALAMPRNFERHGVRLNVVCPTTVDTPFLNYLTADHVRDGEHKRAQVAKENKLQPSEVAAVFLDLIRDEDKNGIAMMITEKGIQEAEFIQPPYKW